MPVTTNSPLTNVSGGSGYEPGGTDVAVADGGTGASTAAAARANLATPGLYSGAGAPTLDTSDGVVPGDLYRDTSAGTIYVCEDASEGAAVWQALGGGSGAAVPARVVGMLISDPNGVALETGDSQGVFRIPADYDGLKLTSVAACLTTASSSGAVTVQVRNWLAPAGPGYNMLSTALTIDQGETDSMTAATPAVIDGANDEVAEGDQIHIDVDGAGTGALGLYVQLVFE